ncbi:MAG: glycoside hydrolase family 5 protein [Oscillospiraceae bacterium]|nr:glycoside hydrolase family 5 protein [Oscillospiraceae bacterium]
MKTAKICALLICFVLLVLIPAACQGPAEEPPDDSPDDNETDESMRIMEFRELSAQQLLSEMGAGWNLGNTLDARRSQKGSPQQQETAWGNPVTSPEMIGLLADTGFRTLRIPVTWEVYIGSAPDYSIDEIMLDRVQEIVDYGIDRDLYVILNTHHENWQFPSYENYEETKAKLVAVWGQIAERFGGYSEKLIFEAMNEPRMKGTNQEWTGGTEEARDVINKWNQAFVEAIRASGGHNERRWLMVPTIAASGDLPALRGFVMPHDESERTIASIHAYTPYNFALNTRSEEAEFDPENPAHTRDIDALFSRLDEYLLSEGIPVIMGETGCLNKENLDARVAWTNYYASVSASYGVPMIWWDNGINITNNGESFGIMDRRNVSWWYPEIAEALVSHFQ